MSPDAKGGCATMMMKIRPHVRDALCVFYVVTGVVLISAGLPGLYGARAERVVAHVVGQTPGVGPNGLTPVCATTLAQGGGGVGDVGGVGGVGGARWSVVLDGACPQPPVRPGTRLELCGPYGRPHEAVHSCAGAMPPEQALVYAVTGAALLLPSLALCLVAALDALLAGGEEGGGLARWRRPSYAAAEADDVEAVAAWRSLAGPVPSCRQGLKAGASL